MTDADPSFTEIERTLDGLELYARQLVGESATVERDKFPRGIHGFSVAPVETRARRIDVIGEQFLIVAIGTSGGRWELSYSDDDVALARDIIKATILGRVSERAAFGRSRVSVTLSDGTSTSETGFDGCLAVLVPQPGWTRWGKLTKYAPYSRESGA